MGTYSVTWISNNQAIGNTVSWTGDPQYQNIWDNQTTYDPHKYQWTYPNPKKYDLVPDPNPVPNPFPFTFPPVEEKDEEGNVIVRAPTPSLELIMIEIAKVLRENGDILEIREIFERHKLKLVDHDGEVIFDPTQDENLTDRSL